MILREAAAADAGDIARVHIDSWRTTYRDIVPAEYLANLAYDERTAQWTRRLSDREPGTVVYLAADENGRIVGFAAGGRRREGDPAYEAELYAIYLLEACQGQRIGRRLAMAVVQGLAAAGMRSMLAWVLADNPFRRLYVALGGQEIAERTIVIGGAALGEVAYGWPDIGFLLARRLSPTTDMFGPDPTKES
jgi:L-amino acid N-acyltransferase YncA